MKDILMTALMIVLLPLVLLALWIVFSKPGMLDAEEDYPVLSNKFAKGKIS